MTVGIYRIFFEGECSYIGQSCNIEERIPNHKSMLKNNSHYNYKLQNVYNKLPTSFKYEIIETLSNTAELNTREDYYINKFNSINNGYNISSGGSSGRGIEHPSCIYTKEQIVESFMLGLNPEISYKEISEITGISVSAATHVCCRTSHQWLEQIYPIEHARLVEIKNNRLRGSSLRTEKLYKYRSLKSPVNIVYSNIYNVSKFSREHALDNNKVREVLKGTRNSHKGWVGT